MTKPDAVKVKIAECAICKKNILVKIHCVYRDYPFNEPKRKYRGKDNKCIYIKV